MRKPDSLRRADIVEGEGPFMLLYRELIRSDAWRSQSINCRRLIDFLFIEHMSHGGAENGNLLAPYDHLVAFGIRRESIKPAIIEAQRKGLIEVRSGERVGSKNAPFIYRLTFLKTRRTNTFGVSYWAKPTHDWKYYVEPPGREVKSVNDDTSSGTGSMPDSGTAAVPGFGTQISGNALGPEESRRREPPMTVPLLGTLSISLGEVGEDGSSSVSREDRYDHGQGGRQSEQRGKEAISDVLKRARIDAGMSVAEAGKLSSFGALGIQNIEERRATLSRSQRERLLQLYYARAAMGVAQPAAIRA